jgi:UDPglucose 6-dehydrogenase
VSRIAVFGAGYVGLVTGACFADLGNDVIIRDVVPERIEGLRRGEIPIYEPGLDEIVERNRERLSFTLDVREAIEGADFLYVAVGTPPTYSGDADLSAVWTVVEELQRVGADGHILVMKSTVPVGTGERVRAELDARGLERVGQALGVPLEQLGHALLVERHLAGAQRLDLLRHDVAHDHLVAELREARPRHQAHPAGPEDAHLRRHPAGTLLRGC